MKREKEHKDHLDMRKLYRNLKISGFCLLALGIILSVVGGVFLAKDVREVCIPCLIIGVLMIGISLMIILLGFIPKFSNYSIKSTQFIQEINKEELEELMSTRAEIARSGASTIFDAFNESREISQKEKIYCKFCGKQIDKDSRFCKFCGKNVED